MKDLALLLHDLRSPLARAKTFAKLLREATPNEREDCLRMLLQSLEEMDKRLSDAQESLPQ